MGTPEHVQPHENNIRETIPLVDANGNERLRLLIEYKKTAEGDDAVAGVQATFCGKTVDLLSEIGVTGQSIKIIFISTNRPPRYDAPHHTVYAWKPDTPFALLVLLHELAHVKQEEDGLGLAPYDFDIPTETVLLAPLLLEKMNLGVAISHEILDEAKRLHEKFIAYCRELPDPTAALAGEPRYQDLLREYEALTTKYPVLKGLEHIGMILHERDAHARANQVMSRLEEQLGTAVDFASPKDRSYDTDDDLRDSIYMRHYRALQYYMGDSVELMGATARELCEAYGVPVTVRSHSEGQNSTENTTPREGGN